ncbi:hypothetical protein BDZ94DRAFT_1315916 [Collybia nuda]|uniref:BTB domain-containing protein n=1 Tax=Collybia nuda TaxID=64659 RepID=A0A9P6CC40_9AGAR|nr:hypothetical protein BDZ94DRAFT_1315916 [Collybia nuda]
MFWQAENTLFCINASALASYSEPLFNAFGLPRPPGLKEGSEEDPILWPDLTAAEVASFLKWMTHIEWTPLPPNEATLVDILKVSHRWMVEQGVAYAIHHLEQLGLPAPHRLELARRFQIVTWIRPAVQSLLDIHQPLSSFSSETDVEYMGPKVYTIITRARELILRE